MNVYGDMLAFFPELITKFVTFTMQPNPVAGYKDRENEKDVWGVLQHVKAGDIDIEGQTAADIEIPTFWTRTKLPKDAYIEDEDLRLYKRTKSNSWKRLGGFYVYTLDEVVGADGRQDSDPLVDLGVSRYG